MGSFKFEKQTTSVRSVNDIRRAIEEVGDSLSYVGFLRRFSITSQVNRGSAVYRAFPITEAEDPFQSDEQVRADYKVGYQWAFTQKIPGGPNPAATRALLGDSRVHQWRVQFYVVDDGPARRVLVKSSGTAQKKETTAFIDHVFALI